MHLGIASLGCFQWEDSDVPPNSCAKHRIRDTSGSHALEEGQFIPGVAGSRNVLKVADDHPDGANKRRDPLARLARGRMAGLVLEAGLVELARRVPVHQVSCAYNGVSVKLESEKVTSYLRDSLDISCQRTCSWGRTTCCTDP